MSWQQTLNKDLNAELRRLGKRVEDIPRLTSVPKVTLRLLQGSQDQRNLVSIRTKEAVFLGLGRIALQKSISECQAYAHKALETSGV